MAVDMGSFEFASPHACGGSFVWNRMRLVGLGTGTHVGDVWTPFINGRSDRLRVSLVCHPCLWLETFYEARLVAGGKGKNLRGSSLHPIVQAMYEGELGDFRSFVGLFLDRPAGQLKSLYDSYKCDTRMRLEDMPWALLEFLQSLGMSDELLESIKAPFRITYQQMWQSQQQAWVLENERELCMELDYF